MGEKKFNLIDEPWILALDIEGKIQQLSIMQAFEKAHKLKCLAGELRTQDVAILRLLLAILYSVFTKLDIHGKGIELNTTREALEHWQSLWDNEAFPLAPIRSYLERYRDRFFLIHSETPFYQVSGLHTATGEVKPVAQIVTDVPSREERRFFSNRSGYATRSLSFDEAARWLVALQSWDYAGKKASIIGGTPNGGGTGWLGKLGVVYLEGKTFFETLLLNFILADDDGLLDFGEPIWHNPVMQAQKKERKPTGYVELLTWQSRRVLLFETDGMITGVLSSYGDVFEKENTFIENMSGWHLSETGQASAPSFIPNIFNKERLLWRDFTSLLPNKASTDKNRAPGTIVWGKLLKRRGLLGETSAYIATAGIEYGSMQGIVNELLVDKLTFSAGFLTDISDEWAPMINDALESTDKIIFALGTLTRDLEKAAGATDQSTSLKAVSSRVREEAYSALDIPFRAWLAKVNPEEDDPDEKCIKWKEFARDTVLRIGENLVTQCSTNVIAGRGKGNDAPSAFMRFQRKLYKEIPSQLTEGV